MLVSPEWVLTAAHCIDNDIRRRGAVRVGAFDAPYTSGQNGGQTVEYFTLADVTTHPNYNSNTMNNDFALLKLDGQSSITPVNMDGSSISNSFSTDQGNLWAIGLGALYYEGSSPDTLKHVQVKYVSNSDCMSEYGYDNGEITNNMMCARDTDKDSCQGDSGGPLYDSENNVLVGVVSFGIGCADSNYPGVYARVSSQYDWIKSTICEDSSNPPTWCGNTPVESPVASPVASPTSQSCSDSPLVFRTKVNGRNRFKSCNWVKKNANRCSMVGASENCPLTCGTCSTCADSSVKFKIILSNGRKKAKDCSWANTSRCDNIDGVVESCRETCGQCVV